MRFPRTRYDTTPFATAGTLVAEISRVVGGERLGQLADADVSTAFRRRVISWAALREFPVVDSEIVIDDDGVSARLPLHSITAQTAIVRATATQPLSMSFTVEPTRWAQRLRSRFLRSAFRSEDAGFDRRFHVVTSNPAVMHHVLDDELRELLRDVACWCRVAYSNGAVELMLDDDRLAPSHVLDGVEVALRLASARFHESAYR